MTELVLRECIFEVFLLAWDTVRVFILMGRKEVVPRCLMEATLSADLRVWAPREMLFFSIPKIPIGEARTDSMTF
ncbi:hypothetical protein B296_00054199 [Ensete ventricosum]|uniref:Uncharacterized protein n=1 Tax=Ensete ventricosum TaxID=4639 RepID=A0A426Y5C8_ENSVE|nr:hypothetical protein B296_00054199 [Ensete ventricosum]